jgi:hypothetical protein
MTTTETSTDLATTGSTDVATIDEWAAMAASFDDGTQTFIERFGLSMPRLRSDFGRNGKGWIDDLTGEAVDDLTIVILAMPPSRAFWIKTLDEGGSGGPPDCSSKANFRDERPDDNVPVRQSPSCRTCEHAQWIEHDDGTAERPRCAESINVLAHDATGERGMFWLRFAGTGIAPFRNYISALLARKLPAFAVETHVTLTTKTRDRLEWLVPVFQPGETLTPAEVQPYREVAEKAMQAWASIADEMAANEEGGTSTVPPPPGSDEEPF